MAADLWAWIKLFITISLLGGFAFGVKLAVDDFNAAVTYVTF